MHTTFTGNSRRPRQVNLSGGKTTNPWANLTGPKSAQTQSGSHNAVAQAQIERQRRAHDRDRLNAAKKIQRVWRGHAERSQQTQRRRAEWDGNEQSRTTSSSTIPYDELVHTSRNAVYTTEDDMRYQMRLLLSFLDVHDDMDRWRLCFAGQNLYASSSLLNNSPQPLLWNQYLSKLSRIVSRSLARASTASQRRALLALNIQLLEKPIVLDYDEQFVNLAACMLSMRPEDTAGLISDSVQALLLRKDSRAYEALLDRILTQIDAKAFPNLEKYLAITRNQSLYCDAVSVVAPNQVSDSLLTLLSNTIYLWRSIRQEERILTWISAISQILNKCATAVAERIHVIDHDMAGTVSNRPQPIPEPARERILTLAKQETVREVMQTFSQSAGTAADIAKPLANYAVALLRAFPTRTTDIRMWLFQNSPSALTRQRHTSTIQYLWKASISTRVFKSILSDQTNVISTLTEAKPSSNQFNYRSATEAEIVTWQEEWRIVLLFLELYTFILQLMDDEEFFAFDDNSSTSSAISTQFRQGALPISEIANLGGFLKHLAFALYWNAVDLAEYNEVEDTASLATLFGHSTDYVTPSSRPTMKTLAGNDVSQAYMKGLATGLLRLLYERDSRRKFLPEDYWLMTRHFEMQGFIPAVVAEEERRHDAFGDDEDDEDIEISDDYDQKTHDRQMPTIGSLFNIRAPHTPRSQTSKQAEQLAKQRELARKRRQLQSLNPRLELLRNLPFFIPFETRVEIFRRFVYRDQERRRNGFVEPDHWRMSIATLQGRDISGRGRNMDALSRHHADIHRGSVFEDAFETFYGLGEELKEPIQISFIDQFGQPEAGIDGGGVTKEFLMSVTSEALDPRSDMPLFEENDQRYLYPRPTTFQQVRHMLMKDGNRPGTEGFNEAIRGMFQRYEFLGRIIGKCMYEGILIDVNFAGFFLLKWALTGGTTSATTETSYHASINDLRDFDDQLYQGLLKLKNYPGDVEADFGLNFTVSDTFDDEGKSVTTTTNLIKDGSDIPVTNANRSRYINQIVRYRLQEQPRAITNAFLRGLGQIISPMWLAMFNQKELQKLVGGDNQELDILDLRSNTQYGGVYVIGNDGLEHPVVAMFWKVLKDMSDEDRRKVLKFVTSTPRAPLLGFSHLNPKFSIRDASEDQSRLPSTSTCVNLLKLPRYVDEKTMREKLLYAANAGAGFDLS